MNQFGAEIYEQLAASAEAAGLKIISDEWACKLLGWLYAFGGGNEAVVFNVALYRDIKIAQYRLNLRGGETPNKKLLPRLQRFLKEVDPFFTLPSEEFIAPEWVGEICDHYGMKSPVKIKDRKK